MSQKKLFTTKQFADLHDMNKRTLMYYDDIGLFHPAIRAENGYRYYTYRQSPALEMLLTLRELDMSIADISAYMKNRNPENFADLLAAQLLNVEAIIDKFSKKRELLQKKQSLVQDGLEANIKEIKVVECEEEYLVLSHSIQGVSEDEETEIMLNHVEECHDHYLFNHSFGCMISATKLLSGDFEDYACFYTKTDEKTSATFVKPAGRYIIAYAKGRWELLPEAYERIMKFAKNENLKIYGYGYELGIIDEIAISTMDNYLTMIMVSVE